MSSNDSIQKTLTVAFLLCIVCSVIVSTAAVVLKPSQEANKALDQKRNILAAAGMLEDGRSVEEQFSAITTRVVDLRTGKFSDDIDPARYDQRKASKEADASDSLSKEEDTANIFRREHYALVYMVEGAGGSVDKVILPIRGAGLWGQMYGFIALEGDANTVAGLGFYEHKETRARRRSGQPALERPVARQGGLPRRRRGNRRDQGLRQPGGSRRRIPGGRPGRRHPDHPRCLQPGAVLAG